MVGSPELCPGQQGGALQAKPAQRGVFAANPWTAKAARHATIVPFLRWQKSIRSGQSAKARSFAETGKTGKSRPAGALKNLFISPLQQR
jgi:hypothetical protein